MPLISHYQESKEAQHSLFGVRVRDDPDRSVIKMTSLRLINSICTGQGTGVYLIKSSQTVFRWLPAIIVGLQLTGTRNSSAKAQAQARLLSSRSVLSGAQADDVQVIAEGNRRFLGASVINKDGPPSVTQFAVSRDKGETWSEPETYVNKNFDLSVNPTVASFGKSLFRVVFSPMGDFSKGVLEFSKSSDEGRS